MRRWRAYASSARTAAMGFSPGRNGSLAGLFAPSFATAIGMHLQDPPLANCKSFAINLRGPPPPRKENPNQGTA